MAIFSKKTRVTTISVSPLSPNSNLNNNAPASGLPESSLSNFSTLRNEEQKIKDALFQATKIPRKISFIFGITLWQSGSSGELYWKFWSLRTFLFFWRIPVAILSGLFIAAHQESYKKVFGGFGATEEFSHSLPLATIFVTDGINALLTFRNFKHIKEFHTKLIAFVTNVTMKTRCKCFKAKCDGPPEYFRKLKGTQKLIERKIYVIFFLFFVGFTASSVSATLVTITFMKTDEEMWKVIWTVPIAVAAFFSFHSLRQIAFFEPIAALNHLTFGITVLKDMIKRYQQKIADKGNKGNFMEESERIYEFMGYFQTIYDLVDLINLRLQWIFISGVASQLVAIICGSFQFFIWANTSTIISILGSGCMVICNALTFYSLCSASSGVTTEAKNCMGLLRDLDLTWGIEWDSSPEERALKQRIWMWHMEGTLQPPVICPGYFFILRRRIIPPIVGMMITYLLVLVQFRLKDVKDTGGEDRHQLMEDTLKDFGLAY